MNQDGSLDESEGLADEDEDEDLYYDEEEKDFDTSKKRRKAADSDEDEPEARYVLRTGIKRQKTGKEDLYQA